MLVVVFVVNGVIDVISSGSENICGRVVPDAILGFLLVLGLLLILLFVLQLVLLLVLLLGLLLCI